MSLNFEISFLFLSPHLQNPKLIPFKNLKATTNFNEKQLVENLYDILDGRPIEEGRKLTEGFNFMDKKVRQDKSPNVKKFETIMQYNIPNYKISRIEQDKRFHDNSLNDKHEKEAAIKKVLDQLNLKKLQNFHYMTKQIGRPNDFISPLQKQKKNLIVPSFLKKEKPLDRKEDKNLNTTRNSRNLLMMPASNEPMPDMVRTT